MIASLEAIHVHQEHHQAGARPFISRSAAMPALAG